MRVAYLLTYLNHSLTGWLTCHESRVHACLAKGPKGSAAAHMHLRTCTCASAHMHMQGCVLGKGSKGSAAAHMGGMGMVLLPPGGSDLHVQNEAEIEAELLVALGRPQRKPHVKYVGYGGAFIHRTVEQVWRHGLTYQHSYWLTHVPLLTNIAL